MSVLDILQAHLGEHDFFFGERPSRADFALFGQLSPMLWWDPTPAAIGVERAPRAIMWIQWVDDLSWWHLPFDENAGWFDTGALPETTRAADALARVPV